MYFKRSAGNAVTNIISPVLYNEGSVYLMIRVNRIGIETYIFLVKVINSIISEKV